MRTPQPYPTSSHLHPLGDGFRILEKQAGGLADLAEDILTGDFPGKDFATCDAELGMMALTFATRQQVAYLYVGSKRHPRNIANDEGVRLSDFVTAGWLAPVFDEKSLPPASARPFGGIPLARLSNREVERCIDEYNRMVADTDGGKRFRKKSWPNGLWRGEVDVLRDREVIQFDFVPDALTVVVTTIRGGAGTDDVMRPLARNEFGGGWVFAQRECNLDCSPSH